MVHKAQILAQAIGESGCYFLSLLKVAEESGAGTLDILNVFEEAVEGGWCAPDCFVMDPARMLTDLTRTPWDVLKAGPGHVLPLEYVLSPGEREILRYGLATPGGEKAHFVVGDGKQGIAWDPYPGSKTVREGKLVSRRILRRL